MNSFPKTGVEAPRVRLSYASVSRQAALAYAKMSKRVMGNG